MRPCAGAPCLVILATSQIILCRVQQLVSVVGSGHSRSLAAWCAMVALPIGWSVVLVLPECVLELVVGIFGASVLH